MRRFAIHSATTVALTLSLASTNAYADALSKIQGAWAAVMTDCSDVFATKGGKLSLMKRQDDALPGFIVDGRKIRGVAAACDIASAKENADGMTLLLSCQSQIMFGSISVSIKLPDPGTLIRVDPNFPEITTKYHKCNA
jgi:hypothetical protein